LRETVPIAAGPETAYVSDTLRPLGSIRGVARVLGVDSGAAPVNIWIRARATLFEPARADSAGGFLIDSLPEGVYELIPQCYTCQPAAAEYRVEVKAGEQTVMTDTVELSLEYFYGFPS